MTASRHAGRRVGSGILCGFVALALGAPVRAQSSAATKSVDSLNAVLKETTKVRTEVQGALDSLKGLTSGEHANLAKNYKSFDKNVTAMTKAVKTVEARGQDMRDRRDAYLEEWNKKAKAVSSPEIQKHMEERAAAVQRVLESIQPAGQAAREAFGPFLTELQDIDKLLSVDLSASGVAAATPIAEKAMGHGTTVLQNIDSVIASLTQIRDQVSPKAKK
jgi:uncharacterized protein YukE